MYLYAYNEEIDSLLIWDLVNKNLLKRIILNSKIFDFLIWDNTYGIISTDKDFAFRQINHQLQLKQAGNLGSTIYRYPIEDFNHDDLIG